MLEPRDYQSSAIKQVFRNWVQVAKEGLLVMPTGSGKTETGAMVIARALEAGKATLWPTHTEDLVEQSASRLHRALGVPVGIVAAGKEPTPHARVQVASIQTLVSREERPPADLIIPDEAHHMVASKWGQVLHHYRGKLLLGLTATPQRGDGLPLGDLFRWLVVGAQYSQLLTGGHLVPARVMRPVGLLKGLADDPVAAYLQWGEGRSGFVYVRTVPEAIAVTKEFNDRGIPAAAVHYESSSEERQAAIAGLKSGLLRLLVNVYTLTEGVDVPAASICVIARSIGCVSIMLQMAGRVLRPFPGKTDALVLDLPGVTHDFGLPTEDRDYALDGEGIRRRPGAPGVKVCQKCGLSFLSMATCPRCGYRVPDKKQRVYGVKLVDAGATRGTFTDEQKVQEWARLQSLAIAKGYSDAWATRAFQEKFGERPVRFSDERKEAGYRALRDRAIELGYEPGWARHRYKVIYGAFPPRAWDLAGKGNPV